MIDTYLVGPLYSMIGADGQSIVDEDQIASIHVEENTSIVVVIYMGEIYFSTAIIEFVSSIVISGISSLKQSAK
jgi:hypothetical protein